MQQTNDKWIDEESKIEPTDDRYKTLFERINAAAFLTNFDGQILEANQKSYEFLGYESNELLRLTLQDILTPELDWTSCRDDLAARGCLTLESESVCKNGTHFPVELSISIFRMNGALVMFVLVWDITERKKQENRLKESEKKYHGLFEYTTDGIFVLDARGGILDVNTRMCEILDVTKSSILNKNLFNTDLLTARSLPIVIQEFELLLSEKVAASFATEVKNRQGGILDVEISSFFLVKKDNEVDNFVLIVRDITARNEAETKRACEHELLKTLMDALPDSVYFKDDQHRFILVNKAKAEQSNVSPEMMVGKTDFDFFSSEVAQRIVDDENAIMRSGQSMINKLEHVSREDGSERCMSITKIPRYNEEGDIIGTIAVSRDVTSWKHTEEDLLRNLELLQTLLDTIPDCVSFKDTQHRFVLVNKSYAACWKVCPEAMIGKTDFDFLPADQAEKASNDDTRVMQSGVPIVDEVEMYKRSDGVEQWFSVTKVPRYNRAGKIIGTLRISRNVTELKKLQEIQH